jgi:hypothetical protein
MLTRKFNVRETITALFSAILQLVEVIPYQLVATGAYFTKQQVLS